MRLSFLPLSVLFLLLLSGCSQSPYVTVTGVSSYYSNQPWNYYKFDKKIDEVEREHSQLASIMGPDNWVAVKDRARTIKWIQEIETEKCMFRTEKNKRECAKDPKYHTRSRYFEKNAESITRKRHLCMERGGGENRCKVRETIHRSTSAASSHYRAKRYRSHGYASHCLRRCRDGTCSRSYSRRGACSHHDGIAY